MNRFLLRALLLLAVLPSAEGARPNVLLICVDDLKPVLGCYGDKLVKSPNIDRLAARGLVFEKAYCNQAVCAPSRNALLTGLRSVTTGVYDLATNFRQATPDAVTLPQRFKQAGYRTEAVGKLFHVGHGNHEDTESWSVPHAQFSSIAYHLKGGGADSGLTREEALFANKSAAKLPRGAAYEEPDVTDDDYPDGRIAAEVAARLRAAKERKDTPFFIGAGFLKPHLPFCAPKKYWDLYDPAAFTIPTGGPPEGAPSYAPQNSGELRQYKGMPEQGPVPEATARELIHGYHAAVSYVDAQIGKVLDELDRLGLADNTIVVLWGDHGWHLGDHGMWCKHTNYEQAARIPVIIAAPGVTQPATRTASLWESVDLYPTLCELAELPAPPPADGTSQGAVLRDPAAVVKTHILHAYPRGARIGRAIRTATHRLVEWKEPGAPAGTAELELYDYATDPAETRNLVKEQPEKAGELRAILAKYPEAKPQWRGGAAKQDRALMFAGRDKDNDGRLTREEFLARQPDPDKAPARFLKFDKDGDGALTKDEFVRMGN